MPAAVAPWEMTTRRKTILSVQVALALLVIAATVWALTGQGGAPLPSNPARAQARFPRARVAMEWPPLGRMPRHRVFEAFLGSWEQ